MEYTIQKLARLSGVTTRTLRYYDEIGLLRPCRVTGSGYRIYGPAEVDLLQQILFYRELDVPLDEIGRLVHAPNFDRRTALRSHLSALRARQARLSRLIDTVTKTLVSMEGADNMKQTLQDAEKFEAFKHRIVQENEALHGAEVRTRFGDQAIDDANARILGLSQTDYERFQTLGEEICRQLNQAVSANEDPRGDTGRRIVSLHKEWLGFTWKTYSVQAHTGLAAGYVADPRFTAYYDRDQPGCAQFLCDAVAYWAEKLA